MKAGILLNSNNNLCSYCNKFLKLLVRNEIPHTLIDPNSASLLDDIRGCSKIIFRHTQGDSDPKIYDNVYYIAHNIYGIECFPDYNTFWPYEDKIREYYLLKSHNFPIIDSRIFWNYSPADAFLKNATFPIVAKLPKGASSSNVVIVKSVVEGQKIIKQVFSGGVRTSHLSNKSNLLTYKKENLFRTGKAIARIMLIRTGLMADKTAYPEWQIQKDAILFQKFLPGNFFDTRVTVIGNRALAFRRFVRKNDFRASGSGLIDHDPSKIDQRCLEIAFSVSKKLKFSTMAYDFIFDQDCVPQINEMSYCFVDTAVEACPGYWDDKLVWHEGRNWPQYYQLKDFLKMDDLMTIED